MSVAAVLLWSVVIMRIPTLARQLTQRHLWVALAALATAVTLEIDKVAGALNDLPGISSNLSHLIKHIMVVVAAALAIEVVRGIALSADAAGRGRGGRTARLTASIVLLAALFAATPIHQNPVTGLTAIAVREPTLLVYWGIYLLAITYSLVGVARLALSSVTAFPAGSVRTSMAWISIGAAVGLTYCAHKAAYLTASTISDGSWPTPETMEDAQQYLLAATVMIVVVGVLWPTLAQVPMIRHTRAYWAHRRLHPLWFDYYQAEPGIALNASMMPPHHEASFRDIELDLYRRVIEIRDGMLLVRRFAPPQARDLAIREARRVGDDAVATLVGEAAWLELARRAKLRGGPPYDEPVAAPIGGKDLATEITLLIRVARARRTIHGIVDRVEATIGAEFVTGAPPQQIRAKRLAEILTAVLAPAHLVIGLLLVVSVASDTSAARGFAWGVLAALLVGVAPYSWVLISVRRGRLTSRHIPDRRQRLLPLAIAAGFAVTGVGLLAVLGAPRQLVALVGAMLVGLGVTGVITARWKISIHAAVAGGTVTILAIVFGPVFLAAAVVVAATAWSRVLLRDHTVAQVTSGAGLGALIAATVFVSLR